MSEFKLYTPEQEEKIARLREEANKPKSKGIDMSEYDTSMYRPIKATDRVTVTIDGQTVIGYVLAVTRELVKYSKSYSQMEDTYTISTPYGVMKNIPKNKVSLRFYEDLSHIVIPEELKELTTQGLLRELAWRRNYGYDYRDDETGYYVNPLKKFSDDEIRAELRTRPNIRKKKVGKIVKKYSK